MSNGLALATLPVVALGCSIYAVWSLYCGWKESQAVSARTKNRRRRREHPAATVVQWCLFVAFSVALLATGLSIFGKTVRGSPYANCLPSKKRETRGSVTRPFLAFSFSSWYPIPSCQAR